MATSAEVFTGHCVVERLELRVLLSAAGDHSLTQVVASPSSYVLPMVTNTVPSGYTPSQIRHAYGFDQIYFGGGTIAGDGTGQTIAIVDAYKEPYIASDLATFSAQWGLPAMDGLNGRPKFSVVQTSRKTRSDAGWGLEIALDVEWAHAIAPKANIVLVEAGSASLSDMLKAVDKARGMAGVDVVSMSWGAGEFSSESSYDYHFTTPAGHQGVTFVASSGDNGSPVSWPAISPNVLSVGGTTLVIDSSGNYVSESAWSGSGGGISLYEPRPGYQTTTFTMRTNPDIAYNADPNTGVPVYDSYGYAGQSGWFTVGGTSAGAPQVAALIAISDQGRALIGKSSLDGRTQTLPAIYAAPSSDFHDIVTGTTTGSPNYTASAGYDLATGRGSPYAGLFSNQLLLA